MYKIAQFSLTPGQKSATTTEIFVAQVDAYKESLVGKLFVLVEISSKRSDSLKLINFLIDNISHNFYQNEKVVLREKISTLKVEHIFESALAKTNTQIIEFMDSEKMKVGIEEINLTVGVIYENEIHFSNVGNNKALLIYLDSQKDKDGKSQYKLSDISQQSGIDTANSENPKLFSSVMSGEIPNNGYFILSNETLPEYLSSKQIINIVTTLPPASAVEQFKNVLTDINAFVSFLGIIIKNVTRQEKPILKPSDNITGGRQSDSSISGLNTTERKTEKLLTASGAVDVKKWFNWPSQIIENIFNRERRSSEPQTLVLKDKIVLKRKTSAWKNNWLYSLIKGIFAYIINSIFYLFKIISNKEKLFDTSSRTIKKVTNFFKLLFLWYRNLSKKSQALLVIALLALFLFLQNSILLNYENKETEKKEEINELAQIIEQKQNQAEANLLYSNDEGARKLFNEIQDLLNELPQNTEEEKALYIDFKEKYNSQIENLRRVIRLDGTFNSLADLSALNAEARPINLSLFENKIYSADSKDGSIYILDLKDNMVTSVTDLGQPITSLKFPTIDANNNINYLSSDSIVNLNTETEDINALSITLSTPISNIVDSDSYRGRIYFLDSVEGEIYRYEPIVGGFGAGTRWLIPTLTIEDAVSLSIDGHIYVLRKSGEIVKLLRGQREEFTQETVEPPLSQASKLHVSTEDKYIYILEPLNNRLVIFDKSGEYITQYTATEWNDLKDFMVIESDYTIYLLNNTSIFSFSAEALK